MKWQATPAARQARAWRPRTLDARRVSLDSRHRPFGKNKGRHPERTVADCLRQLGGTAGAAGRREDRARPVPGSGKRCSPPVRLTRAELQLHSADRRSARRPRMRKEPSGTPASQQPVDRGVRVPCSYRHTLPVCTVRRSSRAVAGSSAAIRSSAAAIALRTATRARSAVPPMLRARPPRPVAACQASSRSSASRSVSMRSARAGSFHDCASSSSSSISRSRLR